MTNDFYTQKTDAELRFLVANPSFYHADLVRAAREELHRRGTSEAAPPPAPLVPPPISLPAPPPRPTAAETALDALVSPQRGTV